MTPRKSRPWENLQYHMRMGVSLAAASFSNSASLADDDEILDVLIGVLVDLGEISQRLAKRKQAPRISSKPPRGSLAVVTENVQ